VGRASPAGTLVPWCAILTRSTMERVWTSGEDQMASQSSGSVVAADWYPDPRGRNELRAPRCFVWAV
jgi:hypothetical protein